jgi:hypothetical protein
MKHAPEDFVNRLESQFDRRLRIRWSNKQGEWHIEYKVGRQRTAKFFVGSQDDAAIRARDGYAMLLAIREGDRMPCPKCGFTIKVPLFEKAEATCEYCRMQGRDGRYPAVFFPLEGDALLQYLRSMDPLLGHRDGAHLRADAANARTLALKEKQALNDMVAMGREHTSELVGLQSVGYTGKEKHYEKATDGIGTRNSVIVPG